MLLIRCTANKCLVDDCWEDRNHACNTVLSALDTERVLAHQGMHFDSEYPILLGVRVAWIVSA